jgi:pyruvate formate lyase activating enzyme
VTRFYPHLELSHPPPTLIHDLERAWSIGKEEGLWYMYLGNVSGYRCENMYCHNCGELLVERYVFNVIRNRVMTTC